MQSDPAGGPQLDIWFAAFRECGRALLELEADRRLIDPDTAASIERLSEPRRRDERRAAHVALRLALAHRFGNDAARMPFERGPHGKPRLPGLPGDFSLAHIDGAALIAVSVAGPVGIDLEAVRSPRLDERRRQRIEAAAMALRGATKLPTNTTADARFLVAWTRLEAFAKADGRGMGRLMTALGIIGPHRDRSLPEALALIELHAPALEVHDLAIPAPQHFGALACAPGATKDNLRVAVLDVERLAAAVRSP